MTKLTVHQEINVTFAWLSISYFIFYKNIFITKVVHKYQFRYIMSALPIKRRYKFMRSRSRDVVIADWGKSELLENV